jgi:hypothetical protein
LAQPLGQGGGGVGGLIRRRAVDHDRDQVIVLRESLVERVLFLTPGNIARDQLAEIGINRQPRCGEKRPDNGKDEIGASHDEGMASAKVDDPSSNACHCRSVLAASHPTRAQNSLNHDLFIEDGARWRKLQFRGGANRKSA